MTAQTTTVPDGRYLMAARVDIGSDVIYPHDTAGMLHGSWWRARGATFVPEAYIEPTLAALEEAIANEAVERPAPGWCRVTARSEVDLTIDTDGYTGVTAEDKAPAARLRAAAERLLALEKRATAVPWIPSPDRIEANFRSTDQEDLADVLVTGGLAKPADYGLIAVLRLAAAPLAAFLAATADRWEENVLLDRPESDEMSFAPPLAWWCGVCQGAIASRDYANDDMRCHCGWWVEALMLAEAVLPATEVRA